MERLNIMHKEDEVYEKLNQLFQELSIKESDYIIKRSLHIDTYSPDFTILKDNSFFAVVEVKYSLENKSVLERTYNRVRQYMKLTNTAYGYITDGIKAVYLSENSDYEETDDFFSHFKSLLYANSHNKKKAITLQNLAKLQNELKELASKHELDDVSNFIDNLKRTDFIENNGFYLLTEEKEYELMNRILGGNSICTLCRYTSMSGLFRYLDNEKHSMVCLVGMNDKGETEYVKKYMENKGMFGFYTTPINKLNELFILSCCEADKEDDLTMFRLYGDDSQGVCLQYSVKKPLSNYKDFFIAPVSYADANGNHPKLDLFLSIAKLIIFNHFDAWLHFFKSYDYKVEEEVRLLYEHKNKNIKKKWINISAYGIICPVIEFDDAHFPLSLNKITLGANCQEKEVNKTQIETMSQEKNINLKFGVDISKKDSYRVSK